MSSSLRDGGLLCAVSFDAYFKVEDLRKAICLFV